MSYSDSHKLQQAYRQCQILARSHYENFPVASRVLPRRLRPAVTVIYCFSRIADDIADEGDFSPEQRYERLDAYTNKLDLIRQGHAPQDPIFIALADVIKRFQLPYAPFYDLLSAFRQDIEQKRYTDYEELFDYCRRSANPVGRLLLHLYGQAQPELLALSDHICTALQLINFLQDIQQDYVENGRIYLPLSSLQQHQLCEEDIASRRQSESLRRWLDEQISLAAQELNKGTALGTILGGRLGLEMRLIIGGGQRILEKLQNQAPFSRPRLSLWDKWWVVWQAIRKKITPYRES